MNDPKIFTPGWLQRLLEKPEEKELFVDSCIDILKMKLLKTKKDPIDVFDRLIQLQSRVDKLLEENASLKLTLAAIYGFAQDKPKTPVTNTSTMKSKSTPTHSVMYANINSVMANVKKVKATKAKVTPKPVPANLTLSQHLSSSEFVSTSEEFTKAGLLNSNALYSVLQTHFNALNLSAAGTSGQAILDMNAFSKPNFFRLLRFLFQTSDSTHRMPLLNSTATKKNYATICHIKCEKKANPVDAAGLALDIANPAYTSNTDPCVRLQVRYTDKAVKYLKSYLLLNWVSLKLTQPIVKKPKVTTTNEKSSKEKIGASVTLIRAIGAKSGVAIKNLGAKGKDKKAKAGGAKGKARR